MERKEERRRKERKEQEGLDFILTLIPFKKPKESQGEPKATIIS